MRRLKVILSASYTRTSTVYYKILNKFDSFISPVTSIGQSSISTAFEELTAVRKLAPSAQQLKLVHMLDDLDRELSERENHLGIMWKKKKPCIQGIYVYGNPGSGKTMLLDLFFHKVTTPYIKKQRHHFHQFMLQIHGQLFHISKLPKHLRVEYPLIEVANAIIAQGTLIYLDEFQVTGNKY